jgi:hypothetical protein
MINNRSLAISIISLALAINSSTSVHAQSTKINVGYSAIGGDALPAWIAKDAEYSRTGWMFSWCFFRRHDRGDSVDCG